MAWITDAELKDAVAGVLRTFGVRLPDHWAGKISRANTRAYNRLRRIMAGKGYSFADLDTWNEREDFNTDCGICLALRSGRLPEGVEGTSLAEFCKVWEELKEIGDIYDDDGELIAVTDLGSNVSFGSYDTTDDTFTRDTEL